MAKDFHEDEFTESTRAKLRLFRLYVQAWLGVFVGSGLSRGKTITFVDYFAGPGKDGSGLDGSPLIILDVLRGFSAKISDQNVTVRILFNDLDGDKIMQLQQTIETERLAGPTMQITYWEKDFENAFPESIGWFTTGPKLLFLDQSGIRFFRPDIFEKLRLLDRTDFIAFFSPLPFLPPVPQRGQEMRRHIDVEKVFGPATASRTVHRHVVEYFRGLIPQKGRYFLAPYSIKSSVNPANIYGLIFGSGHPLGLQKFLEVAWREDKQTGEADYDIDDDRIDTATPSLFEEMNVPRKIQVFERKLRAMVLAGTFADTGSLYGFVLQERVFSQHTPGRYWMPWCASDT